MNKKQLINNYINESANDKEINFIYEVLSLPHYCTKLDLLKLANKNKNRMTFDTAFPIGLYNEIKPMYNDIDNSNLIYDYTNKNYGELININNLIVSNILKLKK